MPSSFPWFGTQKSLDNDKMRVLLYLPNIDFTTRIVIEHFLICTGLPDATLFLSFL